jgi:DNA-binding NtrC family response regulator
MVTATSAAGSEATLVGRSPCIRSLRHHLLRLSGYDVNVLLEGESGTGKELVARLIHRVSARRDGPFVGVNCAAIHESLLESELFGHQAGAFTGAQQATVGFLRAADGGTILLDEVGDMSESLQSKLLRVLEERTVIPVGGTQPVPIDVRVVAATNRDLARAVEEGTFRRDLYYRLNVIRLDIEPLRRRREDIPLLVQHTVRQVAAALGVSVRSVSPAAMAILLAHDWPGNVRELGNVIQRAYVLGRRPVIEPEDLPTDVFRGATEAGAQAFAPLQAVVRDHVCLALEASNGVRFQAARLLGIGRKSLWRMMRRFDL